MNPKASGSTAAPQGIPLCCIVFVLYNQEHEVEPMLQPFLEAARQIPLQILIYDDGSTDGTGFVVESLIGQLDGDNIVFHKHDLRRGTGLCLNLALEDSAVNAFYYVDKHFDLNTESFGAVLKDLSYSQAAFTFPASNPALDPTQLAVKHASKKKVPASINYIIRKDRIRPDRLFFNPFLQNGHSSELLMRAGVSAKALEASTFFHLPYNEEVYSDLTSQDSRLIMFHSQLSNTEIRGVGSHEDPDLLYEKAEALKSDGRIAAALELCDEVLKRFPRHQNTLKLSVELLKRLKKYIEASERSKLIGMGLDPEHAGKPKEEVQAVPEAEHDEAADAGEQVSGDAEPADATTPDAQTDTPHNRSASEEDEADEADEETVTEKAQQHADAGEEETSEAARHQEADPEEEAVPETEYQEDDENEHNVSGSEPETEPETGPEPEEEIPYERPEHFRHSVIVPVAGFAKQSLEKLSVCLHNFCNPADTELIVIDNACLDDSWEYLQQMADYNFFHVRVITNPVNKGFTHAVNQGIKAAEGDFIVVMHADVTFRKDVVRQLADVLEANPEAAIAGPVTTDCMQEQQIRAVSESALEVIETGWIDGFCFVLRSSDDNRLDERYHYAWYETIDLCYKLKEEGRRILIATGVLVNHEYGVFTAQLGAPLYSDEFLKSLEVFSQKWAGEPELPQPESAEHRIEEIWLLGDLVDPLKPSSKIRERISALMDDKLETELKTLRDITDYDLRNFIRAMMAVNNRGLMRDLEERLSGLSDPGFGVELLRFYFQNQIFSRCKKYIEMLHDQLPQLALLYALRIAWKENDAELGPKYLTDYLAAYPACAEAHFIGAKLYEQYGNKEQAEAFMERARQLDPFNKQ